MEIKTRKGNNPELLMDWNGHPVQCFPAGGETLKINAGDKVTMKSSLIRVANISALNIGYLKINSTTVADQGMPILPYSAEMFSVVPGDVYTVITEDLYITFIRDGNA